MGNALGNSPARPQHGANWYDIRDFGAVPNDTSIDAMGRNSVDRAWDAILAAMPARVGQRDSPCTIFFPGGTWTHNDPLLADRDNLTILGEGRETTRLCPNYARGCTSLQLGLRRVPNNYLTNQPVALGPEHWVDLYGKLDTSMAGAPGARWGYRTNGDSHLTFHSSPWNAANYDYYATTRQLTFDFCLDGRGATIGGGPTDVIGPIDQSYGPQPFGVILGANNAVKVVFRTAEFPSPGLGYRFFSYSTPAAQTGVQKHAIQIDLANAAVSAFVGGVQVATSAVGTFNLQGATVLPWMAASNLSFRPNYYQPFNVGTYSVTQSAGAADGQQTPPADFSLYGMKLSKALRYQANGAGTAQLTAAGGAVNDKYRYGDDGASSLMAYLTLSDPPTGHANCRYGGRMVHWRGNGVTGNGWLMSTNSHVGTNAWCYNPVVKGLTIVGQQPWGDGISLGAVGGLVEVKDVTVEGGFFRSIGGMGMGSSYPIEVTACRLDGAFDAAYFGDSQLINKLDFTANQMGTTGLRLRGCETKQTNMYFGGLSTFAGLRPPGPAIRHLVRLHSGGYAGTYDGITFSYDGEDGNVATQVEIDNHPVHTNLSLVRCKFGLQAAGAEVVLHDYNDASMGRYPLRFSAEGTTFTNWAPAFVQTDGPLARGEIRGGMVPPSATMQHVKNTGPGGVGNVRWVYPLGEYPATGPTDGTWSAGCFAQPNVDGTTTYCTASGTVGSASPPTFTTR